MGTGEEPADVHTRLLIVEDEALVRTSTAELLTGAGYRVLEACEATDALEILESRDDIGAVFTDIELPGMNGLALAGVIKRRWPHIAVLITSGRVRPGPGALPAGTDFVAKPYRVLALVRQLEELIALLGKPDLHGR